MELVSSGYMRSHMTKTKATFKAEVTYERITKALQTHLALEELFNILAVGF